MIIAIFMIAAFPFILSGKLKLFQTQSSSLRVLTYASLMQSWGPGPEIAARFEKETGVPVEFIDAGDAGLLLRKLELFPADVVLGMDQFMVAQVSPKNWKTLDATGALNDRFVPYDHAPMTFIYRTGEIEPPHSLDDLLAPRFKNAIALEDPRTSSPGFLFLIWVLDEKGEDEGFRFLEKLKPNIQSISPSWSTAYGIFTKKRAKLAFSYQTSAVYHWTKENDHTYQAADFKAGHLQQTEYAGVTASCKKCEEAQKFVLFLLSSNNQTLLMENNSRQGYTFRRVAGIRDHRQSAS
jgi:thiamine transport system substrate-binding protein